MTASKKAPCVLVSILVLTVLMAAAEGTAGDAGNVVVITGVVNVTGQLVTDAGESFFIVDDGKGKEVSRLVARLVEVTGYVEGREDSRTINVTEYREIE